MAGITFESLIGGRWLSDRMLQPIRLYGILEGVIGFSGLLMPVGFRLLERLDTALYGLSPALAPGLHARGIVLLLGPATLTMGAKIPVFSRVAAAHGDHGRQPNFSPTEPYATDAGLKKRPNATSS